MPTLRMPRRMPRRSINRLSTLSLVLVLAVFISSPQLTTYASGLSGSFVQSYSHYSPPVDYRPMALYQLKLNRYYYPSGSPVVVEHIHHHNDWGWWDVPFFWGGYGTSHDRNSSFGDRLLNGLIGVTLVVSVIAITAATIYSVSHLIWPYVGAASLTSIELPESSPWKITGYKTAHGGVIRYSDLAFNQDAMTHAKEYQMYDRQRLAQGRFLLLDQENWLGIVDYPVDVDVTFTRFDEVTGETIEQITVNVQRKITNGIKAGAISSRIIRATQNQWNHQLVTTIEYPDWFDFSSWYHKPARLMVDFNSGIYN